MDKLIDRRVSDALSANPILKLVFAAIFNLRQGTETEVAREAGIESKETKKYLRELETLGLLGSLPTQTTLAMEGLADLFDDRRYYLSAKGYRLSWLAQS